MRIETRYGYLIDALRRYPFDKEIKERIEEITFPYQNFDENWFIKSKAAANTPKALKNAILKENDPELIRLYTLAEAITEYTSEQVLALVKNDVKEEIDKYIAAHPNGPQAEELPDLTVLYNLAKI